MLSKLRASALIFCMLLVDVDDQNPDSFLHSTRVSQPFLVRGTVSCYKGKVLTFIAIRLNQRCNIGKNC